MEEGIGAMVVSRQTGEIIEAKTAYTFNDIMKMGDVFARSKLFGMQTQEQAVALMLIAQAEGRHPASAAQDYNIIQNKPALRSEAALRRFQAAGGKVEWKERTEKLVSAIFTHKSSGPVAIVWTMERAAKMGYAEKDNWKKQPMVMLTWRVVAEGVRICYPACLSGLYLVEEVMDFEPSKKAGPVMTEAVVTPGKVESEKKEPEEQTFTPIGLVKSYVERAEKKSIEDKKEILMVIDSYCSDVVGKGLDDLSDDEAKKLLSDIASHYTAKKQKEEDANKAGKK